MRDHHSWGGDLDILRHLLQNDFAPKAHLDVSEKGFKLCGKEAFRLIWESAQSKGNNKLPLTSKKLLAYFKRPERQRQPKGLGRLESDWEDYEYDESECDELEEKEKFYKPPKQWSGDVRRSRQHESRALLTRQVAMSCQFDLSLTAILSLLEGLEASLTEGFTDGVPRHTLSPIWEFGVLRALPL